MLNFISLLTVVLKRIIYCIILFLSFEIEALIKGDPTLVDKYADVSDQTANDLVAHMSARQERKFDYSYYNPGVYDITHWIGPEGNYYIS